MLAARGVRRARGRRAGRRRRSASTPARRADVELRLGGEDVAALDGVDLVVPSPGVPRDGAAAGRGGARAAIPVWSEIELACAPARPAGGRHHGHQRQEHDHDAGRRGARAQRAPHLHRRQPRHAARAAPSTTRPRSRWRRCRRFQLEWVERFRPRVGCLLNVTADHLDRHAHLRRVPRRQGPALRRAGIGRLGGAEPRRSRAWRPGAPAARRGSCRSASDRSDVGAFARRRCGGAAPARRAEPSATRWRGRVSPAGTTSRTSSPPWRWRGSPGRRRRAVQEAIDDRRAAAAPPRAGRRPRRRALVRRFQGDQRRGDGEEPGVVRRAGGPARRWGRQGRATTRRWSPLRAGAVRVALVFGAARERMADGARGGRRRRSSGSPTCRPR